MIKNEKKLNHFFNFNAQAIMDWELSEADMKARILKSTFSATSTCKVHYRTNFSEFLCL